MYYRSNIKCPFKLHFKNATEIRRFYTHFYNYHQEIFKSTLLRWLTDNQIQNTDNLSICDLTNTFIKKVVYPEYMKLDHSIVPIPIETQSQEDSVINLSEIDLSRLPQVMLENGVYENQPQSILTSRNHAQLYQGFLMLGFELGRSTKITKNEFLKIVNDIYIFLVVY